MSMYLIGTLVVAVVAVIGVVMVRLLPEPFKQGGLILHPVPGDDDTERWTCDSHGTRYTITRVMHPDKGECYQVVHDDVTEYVAPSLPLVAARIESHT